MEDGAGVTASHFGICVSDSDYSQRFYAEALGYSFSHEVDFSAPFDTLTETPGLDGHAVFMTKGDVCIELISYRAPDPVGPAKRRPMHQLGLTHMAVIVEDIGATAGRIEALGGTVLRDTRVDTPMGDMMFATDPDGVRIELWEKKENPEAT